MEIYNDDYKKGMKLLISECKKNSIDYHNLKWLIKFNKILSKLGISYKFWNNVILQKRLKRILLCECVEDICRGENTCLFSWVKTKEGSEFWYNNLITPFNDVFYLSFKNKLWLN